MRIRTERTSSVSSISSDLRRVLPPTRLEPQPPSTTIKLRLPVLLISGWHKGLQPHGPVPSINAPPLTFVPIATNRSVLQQSTYASCRIPPPSAVMGVCSSCLGRGELQTIDEVRSCRTTMPPFNPPRSIRSTLPVAMFQLISVCLEADSGIPLPRSIRIRRLHDSSTKVRARPITVYRPTVAPPPSPSSTLWTFSVKRRRCKRL